MDGGAWRAAVHGVAKSRTRLSDFTFTFPFIHQRRKWQPTPVVLPGESQGRGSLVGCRLWGRTESDTTEATQQQQQQQLWKRRKTLDAEKHPSFSLNLYIKIIVLSLNIFSINHSQNYLLCITTQHKIIPLPQAKLCVFIFCSLLLSFSMCWLQLRQMEVKVNGKREENQYKLPRACGLEMGKHKFQVKNFSQFILIWGKRGQRRFLYLGFPAFHSLIDFMAH